MNKIIVFDLDDTLFLERDFVLSGFNAVVRWLNNSNSKIDLSNFYDYCTEIYNSGARGNIFDKALNQCGFNFDVSFMKSLVNIYRNHIPQINLLQDAKLILQFLHGKNPLAIISDGYLHAQTNKVKALNIEKFFDCIVYSDANGKEAWKPSPWSYLQVMDYYSCLGENCIYIGDNVNKDFITAKKMGWKTIHIVRNEGEYFNAVVTQEYEAHFKINSLLKLKRLIDFL